MVFAIVKYTINDKESSIVEINGLAIIAGSMPSFSAIIGKSDPTDLAIITIPIIVRPTTSETLSPTLSKK